MRERYLEAFDAIRIDCLNGDKYKTGKTTPEGEPDPSIFSTPGDPVGIQVGTTITTLDSARQSIRLPEPWAFATFGGKPSFRGVDVRRRNRNQLTLYDAIEPVAAAGPALRGGIAVSPELEHDWPSLPAPVLQTRFRASRPAATRS